MARFEFTWRDSQITSGTPCTQCHGVPYRFHQCGVLLWSRKSPSDPPALIIYNDESHDLGLRVLAKSERDCPVVRSLSSQIDVDSKILVDKPIPA